MRVPPHTETNLFDLDQQRRPSFDADSNLTGVAREWGVETAAECGSAGLRPIWRPDDDESRGERRRLRFGMYRSGEA